MVEKFKIRLADISDMQKVFELSNDDIVRKNSINSKKIEWEEHVKWFSKRIKSTAYPFYIIESPTGEFMAQVRFDNRNDECIVSISIVEKFRGKGFATAVIKECIAKSALNKVCAYVYEDNLASVKTFKKAGFVQSCLLKFEFVRNRERERE